MTKQRRTISTKRLAKKVARFVGGPSIKCGCGIYVMPNATDHRQTQAHRDGLQERQS